jgi:RNA polymerase sigma factor (sigma-70 family)
MGVGATPVGARSASQSLLRLVSDAELVELVRYGDATAFEVAYSRHHAAILSFCQYLLGDPDEAQDAVQQTFLSAYNHLVESDSDIHLRAWLFTIARNRCYTMIRVRRERPSAELTESTTEHLAAHVQLRQDVRDLVRDMQALPEDQRSALVLSELEHLTHAEVAQVLTVPREKVKALVFQARESLLASREARDTDCSVIREQLRTLRGGGLRRAQLRRHLRDCDGCRDFRQQIARRR